MTMFIDLTVPEHSGAIREILPEDLDRISGGIYKAEYGPRGDKTPDDETRLYGNVKVYLAGVQIY
jgi:hypothetical protein